MSDLFGNPHCWFSHDAAQCFFTFLFQIVKDNRHALQSTLRLKKISTEANSSSLYFKVKSQNYFVTKQSHMNG